MQTITAKVETKLKKRPVASAQLQPGEFLVVMAGKAYGIDAAAPAGNNHTKVSLAANSGTFFAFNDHWDGLDEGRELIAKTKAEVIFGNLIDDSKLQDLNACLNRYQINTAARIRHFLAQVAQESGGLQWFQELASGSAYEGDLGLGNTEPGDGPRFKGAGAIQLTGRANYQHFANFIGDPSVMQGVAYVAVTYPFTSAGFWWYDNKLNAFVDQGATCREVSARVNGRDPANGLDERQAYYDKACQVIV